LENWEGHDFALEVDRAQFQRSQAAAIYEAGRTASCCGREDSWINVEVGNSKQRI